MEITAKELKEKIESGDKFIVDLYASWCGPCKVLGPIVEKFAQKMIDEKSDVGVYKFNIDSDREYAMELGVRSVPTVMSFSNGDKVLSKVGILPESTLVEMVREL